VLISPALAFVGCLIVVPLCYTIYLSFTDAKGNLRGEFRFVGLDNFAAVLTDTTRFWPAAGRTALFTLVVVAFEMVLGMAIALLLRRPFAGQKIVRGIILLPLVATPIAVGMMWRLLFEPTIGFANQFIGWFGLEPRGWVSDPSEALWTLMFVDIWQWTPMVVLILLAGLTSLPDEPDEAARIDGAGAVKRFRYVTLPLLMPTVIAALVLRAVDAFKTFDILFAMKGPGGGSLHEVETINIYAYGENFVYNRYGLAAAVLVVFFAMVLILLSFQTLGKRRDA
jgi:multiple sugar transport system permease protein